MNTIKTKVAAIFLLAVACSKDNAVTRSSSVSQSTGKTLTFTIGQHYGGGIIFYIDSTGQHGLIAAPQNLGDSIQWRNNNTNIITGATGITVGTGKSNTDKIISVQGVPGTYAAIVCDQDTTGGYTDWFLPSRAELNILHQHRFLISGLTGGNYWSSSEKSAGKAWAQHFHGGLLFALKKTTPIHVRAVRAF